MWWIISGVVSGIIWFSIFREHRFRAKCRYIYNSDSETPVIYVDVMSIKRINGAVVINDNCDKRLMNFILYNQTYYNFIENRYVEKLCKKMVRKWVNYTYKKLRLEEKLSKLKE